MNTNNEHGVFWVFIEKKKTLKDSLDKPFLRISRVGVE